MSKPNYCFCGSEMVSYPKQISISYPLELFCPVCLIKSRDALEERSINAEKLVVAENVRD